MTLGFALVPIYAAESKTLAWTTEDSLTAIGFVRGIASHPEAIDTLVKGMLTRDHDLGFGYRLREVWVNPAGKLGFSLKIVYAQKRPISFEAKPVLNYRELKHNYLAALTPTFPVRSASGSMLIMAPYYWNQSAVSQALPADSLRGTLEDSPLSPGVLEALAFYMTPYSGSLYGIRGGEAQQLLENRNAFLNLTDMLMADRRLARYLLRSLNPASRLTAAEFIVRHHDDFPDYAALQKTAFRAVFANPQRAATMRGKREVTEDARKLVIEYATQEVKRDGRGVLRMY